jgi:hypothetical protein
VTGSVVVHTDPEVPKLFISAEPGAHLLGRPRDFCRSRQNQTEVRVRDIH